MKINRIAEEQIENVDIQEELFNKYDFFKEYFNVFNNSDIFEENVLKSLNKLNKNEVLACTEKLKNGVEDKFKIITAEVDTVPEPGIVTYIGDGSWDGHGILINGQPYVFFDLAAVIPEMNNYNLDIYITHELIHSLHYGCQPEFYPGNHIKAVDKYLKRLIAEGLATYMSQYFTEEDFVEAYWLGLMNEQQVNKWIANSNQKKNEIWDNLQKKIETNDFDLNLFYQLFSIISRDYEENRYGYYYGTQIIKYVNKDKNISDLFTIDFTEYRPYIEKYFSN